MKHTLALSIEKDIAGDDYERFIEKAFDRFAFFSLVWRSQLTSEESARVIRPELRPYQVRHRRTNRWPGTEVGGSKADLLIYRCDSRAIRILMRPGSLFSWCAPKFPEDLAFYGADRRCAVASVAHERDGRILDLEFGHSLPKKLGLVEETVDKKEWRFFDHLA